MEAEKAEIAVKSLTTSHSRVRFVLFMISVTRFRLVPGDELLIHI